MGVEVQRTRWLAYVLAAVGFGAVGGMLIISTLYIDPATVFSVNYSADMLFMVVIGGSAPWRGRSSARSSSSPCRRSSPATGRGTWWRSAAVAIVVVLAAPGGLWGMAARRGWSLLPVGYRVRLRGSAAGHKAGSSGRGRPASKGGGTDD